ncbi:quinone oxidoreductase family protein [Bradyrhizobium sp.]|jgi:NADPH:quinone reductase-like Zn-dependent oxidoreductase|uniref:quinone oxidoreductase family protein n=1 Tax=Bradyrhizobium sp. TaxID=376 RepID=UPI003C1686F1
MLRLRLKQKADRLDDLDLQLERFEPRCEPDQVVLEVHSAGVNMSDVKAALGAMPHAIWPRTPGRDWSGIVLEGPAGLRGREVWGTGGDLGISRDGSHSHCLVLPSAAVRPKPEAVGLIEAGAVGVPFVTAYEGFRCAGLPQAGDVVLVLGANGKVGQAAIQIATMLGARVFGVEAKAEAYRGHANAPVRMIDAASEDVAAVVRRETDGGGANIVFNTVGSVYFETACEAMALGARQIFISTIDRAVAFDILRFYRGRHAFFGIDTLALDAVASAEILETLTPGFETGTLKPFAVDKTMQLASAKDAYRAVQAGSRERIVLTR